MTEIDAEMERMQREVEHANARTLRKEWCECCGRAVPQEHFSTKFAQAGGVLAGPFCSSDCYWRFIRDGWEGTDKQDRRQFYIYNDE